MSIQLPKLPFSSNALDPILSQKTIEFHYGKHHKHYVDTLNELIQDTPLDKASLEEILTETCGKNSKIFNNAAQVWNHTFMWHCLTPKEKSRKPSSTLESLISKNFESLQNFKKQFEEKAKNLFGSGWVWLVKDKAGQLHIRDLGNAENPMLDGEMPLFTCDVWEHAYYLDYQNERDKYVKKYWEIVNWEFIDRNLDVSQDLGLKNAKKDKSPLYSDLGLH